MRNSHFQLQSYTFRSLIISIGISIILLLLVSEAFAQRPGETASPQVADVMKQRAEQFLKEVARLSPVPKDADPNLTQVWPRPAVSIFHPFGSAIIQRNPRENKTTIIGDNESGKPHQGNRWKVSFYGSDIQVIIDSETGRVAGFFDFGVGTALKQYPPPQNCLDRNTAISRALAYLQAAGIDRNELTLEMAKINTLGNIPDNASSTTWYIDFQRSWHGVPYDDHDGHCLVILDTQYGLLIGFGAQFGAIPPRNQSLIITPQRAEQIAQQAARSFGQVSGPYNTDLFVVFPNNFLTTGARLYPEPVPTNRQAQLVWKVRVWIRGKNGDDHLNDIYINANDGSPVGGRGWGDARSPGGRQDNGIPDKRFEARLDTAQRIEARALPLNDASAEKPLQLQLQEDSFRFYAMLAGTMVYPGAMPEAWNPTHRITFTLSDGSQLAFDLDVSNGQMAFVSESKQPQKQRAANTLTNLPSWYLHAGCGLMAWIKPLPTPAQPIPAGPTTGSTRPPAAKP